MDFENANVDIWGLTHQSCSTCDGIVMPGWMHLFTGCAFSSIVSFLYLKLRVDLMWVKIIIIGGQWKGRVCNKPKSCANREKNMSVLVFIGGQEDIHQALQLGCWEWGGGSDSQLRLHLFPCGTSKEKRENTYKQCFWEREREGAMVRESTGSLLSLKGKALKKWTSCPDMFILNSIHRKAAWESYVKINS